MKSKIFKFLLSLSICIVLIIASSPFVFAASNTYEICLNQPRTDNYSGYVEYLIQEPDGSINSYVTFWHVTGSVNANNIDVGVPKVYVTVKPFEITLRAVYTSSNSSNQFNFILSGGTVNSVGDSYYWAFGPDNGNSAFAYAYSGTRKVLSYKLYGNFIDSNSTVDIADYNYNIIYSETSALYETMLFLAQSVGSGNQAIIQNASDNTDKLLYAGSDKGQPDFGATNGKLDDTVGQIESIEGSYQIDQVATNTALSTGTSFLQGSDMQRASIQVKTWIERFSTENRVVSGFLIAAMVLGLCFWIIGRKAWSK